MLQSGNKRGKKIVTGARSALTLVSSVCHVALSDCKGKKVKLTLQQVVEAHSVVRRRGFHIF
jgi:hypothetical protein